MPTANCPYCDSKESTEIGSRPGRETLQCNDCGKYYARKNNGKIYPLVDPEDSRSQPTRK